MSAQIAIQPRYRNIEEMLIDFARSSAIGHGEESRSVDNQTVEQSKEAGRPLSLHLTPHPIKQLRELQEGWDGRDAEPPSELLLTYAEAVWKALDTTMPPSFMRPAVRMSRDGYIAFSWIKPEVGKQLHVWLHEDDPISYEVHLKTPTKRHDEQSSYFIDVARSVLEFFGT